MTSDSAVRIDPALEALRERIAAATAARWPLRFRGGGTKDFYGLRLAGEIVDTRGYAGIVDYEPTELVITARCGTPMIEVMAALAERRQMLAFEPPCFGDAATIGGVFAAGLSGPRRVSAGALRDFVLGAMLIDGRGTVLRFGGQVMKNVAGYDVARMLAGSLGLLGLIAEVSLKVLPVPAAEVTLKLAMDEATALDQLNTWGGQPWPISASAWQDGVLHLRLSGAAAAVDAAVSRFRADHGAEVVEPVSAARLWTALREHTDPFFRNAPALWRFSVPSTAPRLNFPGRQLIEWGGAQRWLVTDVEPAILRRAADGVGGSATLFRGGDKTAGVFQPLSTVQATIHRRLRAEFDPAGIFNPQRMYEDV